MNAKKIAAANANAEALNRQLNTILAQIPYATFAKREQLVKRAAKVRAARNVALGR